MDFQKSYYIIEHKNKYEIISHENLMALDKATYQLIQNFANRNEAIAEMIRLVGDEQEALKIKTLKS